MANIAIVLAPVGEYRAPRCVIDEFEPGELTVTSLDHCQEVTQQIFEQHLRDAGNFIGVGRFRPRNNGYYGRFKVVGLKWATS